MGWMEFVFCSYIGADITTAFAKIKLRIRSISMNIVGPAVRHLREQQALTQEQLVARCNVLGWDISRGTLAKIEAQVRRVVDSETVWLAAALRVPVEQLF